MIRVIIKRQVREGCFQDYLEMIRRARKRASLVEGFIAGELLQQQGQGNSAFLISSWETIDAWNKWQASTERAEVLQQMRPLLTKNEEVTVLESCQLMR